MANNIGLDFGTTYSVISRIKQLDRDETGKVIKCELEACLPGEGVLSPCQDSLVLKKNDNSLEFGSLARESTGRKGSILYKGFKMMLAETDEKVLKARGYTHEYTPERIIKEFIDDILKKYMETYQIDGNLDKVVIGVPEIWFKKVSTIDCRTKLENIVSSLPYVNKVELVSEPAAACAYFVNNFKKENHYSFKGKVLIIDYGGGTLDIALCDVREKGEFSEVSVMERCGAGLNEEGYIGKAGVAFIEEIVKLALSPTGLSGNEIINNRKFYKCAASVENALMLKMKDIKNTFDFVEIFNRESINDEFYSIEFDDEPYSVTYGMLAKAYNKVISPVLGQKLGEMLDYINTHNITVDKIISVGGFCNFYLTQAQIEDAFARGAGDSRFSDAISDKRECEKAISYGAALIAEDIISFKHLSPYYLGFGKGSDKELKKAYYIIKKGDVIDCDKPVFVKNPDGTDTLFIAKKIPLFVFNLDDSCEKESALWGEPLGEYQKMLELRPLESWQRYKLGISLDKSMIITLHKQIVDVNNPNEVYEEGHVRLDEIYAILGNMIEERRN